MEKIPALSYKTIFLTTLFFLNPSFSHPQNGSEHLIQDEKSATFENVLISQEKSPKILNGPSRPLYNNYPQSPKGNYGSKNDLMSQGSVGQNSVANHPSLSPVDMQILSALEKLVGRIDGIDTRVKTLESIVHYLAGKEKPEIKKEEQLPIRGSCPSEFYKIDGIRGKCYYISSLSKKSSGAFDWKSAAGECAKLGGRLAEMLSYSDFHRISTYLAKYMNTRNMGVTDFWTGGLNPGLIWIWSESGQQVELDKRFWNENENGSSTPGCLKLSYSLRLNSYFYKGAPCSQSQNFICEVLDNSLARALEIFEKNLLGDNGENSSESEASKEDD